MMATYRSSVVSVVLFIVYSVYSASIKGTIQKNWSVLPSEVEVVQYINGEDFNKVQELTLNRLVASPPKLTLANFNSITIRLTNISLEHIPIFENTTCMYIIITENKIQSVPANAFSVPRPFSIDLSKNEIRSIADRSINMGAGLVRLNCNKLRNFSQTWFEDPSTISLLNLAGNRIEYIQDRAFSQMTRLYELYLSYNHITEIGSEVFLPIITQLYLQFNNISQLEPDMFADPIIPTQILYLHHNKLNFLPKALMLKLKPKRITLDDNPWQCQCLRDIERWIRELDLIREYLPSRRGEPVCIVPRNFENVCVPFVDKELQQTHATGLSPVQGCLATPCSPCEYYR